MDTPPHLRHDRDEIHVRFLHSLAPSDRGRPLTSRNFFGRKASVPLVRDAAGAHSRERGLHPFRDKPGFLLGHHRDDLDGHAVRVRIVAGYELNAAFEQMGCDEDVAR